MKKFSDLTEHELMHTPIRELLKMEEAEFPEACAAIDAYELNKLRQFILESNKKQADSMLADFRARKG